MMHLFPHVDFSRAEHFYAIKGVRLDETVLDRPLWSIECIGILPGDVRRLIKRGVSASHLYRESTIANKYFPKYLSIFNFPRMFTYVHTAVLHSLSLWLCKYDPLVSWARKHLKLNRSCSWMKAECSIWPHNRNCQSSSLEMENLFLLPSFHFISYSYS